MAISVENRVRARKLAKEVFEIMGGHLKPDGKHKTFDELETEATLLGDLITSLAIQEAAEPSSAGAASDAEPTACCPKCERTCKPLASGDEEAMVLQTARGEVHWMTEGYFCRRCRRSFFPSAGCLGDSRRSDGEPQS